MLVAPAVYQLEGHFDLAAFSEQAALDQSVHAELTGDLRVGHPQALEAHGLDHRHAVGGADARGALPRGEAIQLLLQAVPVPILQPVEVSLSEAVSKPSEENKVQIEVSKEEGCACSCTGASPCEWVGYLDTWDRRAVSDSYWRWGSSGGVSGQGSFDNCFVLQFA